MPLPRRLTTRPSGQVVGTAVQTSPCGVQPLEGVQRAGQVEGWGYARLLPVGAALDLDGQDAAGRDFAPSTPAPGGAAPQLTVRAQWRSRQQGARLALQGQPLSSSHTLSTATGLGFLP